MRSPPLTRHDAHLVVAQAFDCDDLVFITEKLGFCGRIWHPEEHHKSHPDSDGAKEQEDNLLMSAKSNTDRCFSHT